MNLRLKPVLAGVVGFAAAAALAPLALSNPASAAPTLQGPAEVRTAGGAAALSSGDSNDVWTLRLGAGARCGGDNNAGYRVQGYLVSSATNPATLTFNSDGPTPFAFGSPQANVRLPLYDTQGTPYLAFPTLEDALIVNIPDFSYGVWTPGDLPPGEYNVGIACVLNNAVEEYWNVKKTFTANTGDGAANVNWARGGVAAAPTLTGVAAAQSTCTATFTPGTSDPAATTYTAKATPTGGGSTVSQSGAASPIAITGLANFTSYDVVVTATNAVGESAASNTIQCTPTFTRPAVTNLAAAVSGPGDTSATLSWTPPTGDAPLSYSIVVTGPTPGSFSTPAPATGFELTDLAVGNYTATVTPVHESQPNGDPASVTFTITPVYVDPCAPPRGLLSGVLWALGLRPLAVSLCRAGL